MNNQPVIESGISDDIDIPGLNDYDIITGTDVKQACNEIKENLQNKLLKRVKSKENDECVTRIPLTHKYEDEWSTLFSKEEIDFDDLKQKSLRGDLRSNHFRSVCWRCLLGILNRQPQQWVLQLKCYRESYNNLLTTLESDPWNVDAEDPLDNPLSQDSESVWQKYFSDKELRGVIFQDVMRTFPGVDFFREAKIQSLMVRILFCYARQNPLLCYRQGMHEILAPIVFILHCDHEAFRQAAETTELSETTKEILNPEFLEQDAYTVFRHVMAHIECSYRISNLVTTSSGYFPTTAEQDTKEKVCENEVVNRLEHIKENLLSVIDLELTQHLATLDIPLQLFGIRWLRLLFGREFPLQDLLVLWDAIFAEGFDLVDYIVVAMLTSLRQYLLESDYTTCLTCLMRYPPGVDVGFIISSALNLKDPLNYPPVPPPPALPLPRLGTQPTPPRPKAPTDVRRLKTMPTPSRPTQWMRQSKLRNGEGDGSIVDGFTTDDPNVMLVELDHARAVMSLVRLKLTQYHQILTSTLPYPISSDSQQALDGLHELCYLLKTNQSEVNTEVEAADEAGEVNPPQRRKASFTTPVKPSVNREEKVEGKAHTLPKIVKKPLSGRLEVFRETKGQGPIQGAPMEDPLRLIKDSCYQDETLYSMLKDWNKPQVERKTNK